jgi:hypothetical protein
VSDIEYSFVMSGLKEVVGDEQGFRMLAGRGGETALDLKVGIYWPGVKAIGLAMGSSSYGFSEVRLQGCFRVEPVVLGVLLQFDGGRDSFDDPEQHVALFVSDLARAGVKNTENADGRAVERTYWSSGVESNAAFAEEGIIGRAGIFYYRRGFAAQRGGLSEWPRVLFPSNR